MQGGDGAGAFFLPGFDPDIGDPPARLEDDCPCIGAQRLARTQEIDADIDRLGQGIVRGKPGQAG